MGSVQGIKSLTGTGQRIRNAWAFRGTALLFSALLALLLAVSLGCGPPSSGGAGTQAGSSDEIPEITDEIINERINTTWLREVPEENGAAEPIHWGFRQSEPKEIAVIEKQMDGTRATITLDIKTRSSPRSREQRQLAGRLRTEWELQTGWALRTWEIVNAENISVKYRNLPKPSPQPSNKEGNAN